MKNTDCISSFKSHKRETFRIAIQIGFGLMVFDNIADLIPRQWKMESDNWRGDIRISPKGDALTADRFDKLLTRLSTALHVEPDKSISKKNLHASLDIYRRKQIGDKYTNYDARVRIEITAENTESCEIFTEEIMVTETRTVLSGYCKALAEKHYLSETKKPVASNV